MGIKLDEMVVKLLEIYTQDELKDLWGVSLKSIDNYKNGGNPNKKLIPVISETYKKLHKNGWLKIPIAELKNFRNGANMNLTELAAYVIKNNVLLETILSCIAELLAEKRKGSSTAILRELEKTINQKIKPRDVDEGK